MVVSQEEQWLEMPENQHGKDFFQRERRAESQNFVPTPRALAGTRKSGCARTPRERGSTGISWHVLTYFLSQNTIHSISRAQFILPVDGRSQAKAQTPWWEPVRKPWEPVLPVGPVPVPSGSQLVQIQNMNLNSKNEKISQNSQKYFKVCRIKWCQKLSNIRSFSIVCVHTKFN
jgi:hypothetical protein